MPSVLLFAVLGVVLPAQYSSFKRFRQKSGLMTWKARIVDSLGSYGGGVSQQLGKHLRALGAEVEVHANDEQWSLECGYLAINRAPALGANMNLALPCGRACPRCC